VTIDGTFDFGHASHTAIENTEMHNGLWLITDSVFPSRMHDHVL